MRKSAVILFLWLLLVIAVHTLPEALIPNENQLVTTQVIRPSTPEPSTLPPMPANAVGTPASYYIMDVNGHKHWFVMLFDGFTKVVSATVSRPNYLVTILRQLLLGLRTSMHLREFLDAMTTILLAGYLLQGKKLSKQFGLINI